MMPVTTIQLHRQAVAALKKAKEYPRQTYSELVLHMTRVFTEARKRNQYDEFLHRIQQPKMRELWDNPADEVWERA